MTYSLIGRASAARRHAWAFLALLVCLSPLAVLLVKASTHFSGGLLHHLLRTVLPMQLGYSLLAAAGAALLGGALALGGLACALFEFRGRWLLERLLLLPWLVPSWFLAELYRERQYADGIGGLVLVLGISSAPLVQLFGTAALRRLPQSYLDVLRLLGQGQPLRLARVLFPLAVPALGAAAAVVLLLSWADVACARVMAVPTLTVGLFDQWFGREDDAAGALLASVLLVLSLLPTALLWALLARMSCQDSPRLAPGLRERRPLAGWRAFGPWLLGLPQLVAGVLLPGFIMSSWTFEHVEHVDLTLLGSDILHTLLVALTGTLGAALLALPLLHVQTAAQRPRVAAATGRLSFAAFALSPSALGLVMLWLLATPSDRSWLARLNATALPLIAACAVHFCAVFVAAGQAALLRQAHAHCAVARLLGRNELRAFLQLFHPFLAGPLTAAGLFVLLELLKELSLSLLLQPFAFNTLSTQLFQYAQTQQLRECAVWVVCLAMVGLYPLFSLARLSAADREEPHP